MSGMETFGEWVRRQRKSQDLTQETLALLSGCAFETIRKIEAGRRKPSRQLAEHLARKLRATEAELPAILEMARTGTHDGSRGSLHAGNAVTGNASPSEGAEGGEHDAVPGNLPAPRNAFVGRHDELESLTQLLAEEDTRLITLIGPPGTGKTRLSRQVASAIQKHFSDGVFVVPLSPVTEPAMVVPAIAHVLGIKETSDQPLGSSLSEYLRPRELLLVLDNLEHVVDARTILGDLLTACPRLKMLVTSRMPLHLYGEHQFLVPTLAVPDPTAPTSLQALGQFEAVQLFMHRVRSVNARIELTEENAQAIAQICYQLDGLPLAIELAAARCGVLSPQALLNRLNSRLGVLTGGPYDLPPRQQTLRHAIDWSYDLLSEDERVLFRRISVFVGGGTIESIEVVCAATSETAPKFDMLATVDALTEKSLLNHDIAPNGEPVFWMLWTMREYAQERLTESGEEATVRERHAEYFLELAEAAESRYGGREREEWLQRLATHLGNLRVALDWWLSPGGDPEKALRMAGALHWFWSFRGFFSEGRRWIEKALQLAGRQLRTPARAKTLYAAGRLALLQHDFSSMLAWLEEAVDIWREVGDRRGLAYALADLGAATAFRRRDLAGEGRALIDEAILLFREVDDRWGLALALDIMGDVTILSGGSEAEVAAYKQESLLLYRQLGDRWGIATLLAEFGYSALRQSDYDVARSSLEEALSLAEEISDRWCAAHASRGLGDAVWHLGDRARARMLYERSLLLYRELGNRHGEANALRNLGHLALERGDDGEAKALYRESLLLAQQVGSEPTVALCLAAIAGLAAVSGSGSRATRILAAADKLRLTSHGMLPPADLTMYNRNRDRVRGALGDAEFDRIWREGQAMTLEETFVLVGDAQRDK